MQRTKPVCPALGAPRYEFFQADACNRLVAGSGVRDNKAKNALAQMKCKTVVVHMNDYWEFAGIEDCGFLGYCGVGRLVGTFNGRLFVSGLDSDTEYPSFGDSHVWKGQNTIETVHGEIFTTVRGVNYWETFTAGGLYTSQESLAVTGGTGRYEGATGYFLMYYEFFPPDFFPGTGAMSGQVCWPEE